jgi:hypothetical protein
MKGKILTATAKTIASAMPINFSRFTFNGKLVWAELLTRVAKYSMRMSVALDDLSREHKPSIKAQVTIRSSVPIVTPK